MGRQSRQIGMLMIDMESMIPSGHLLRKIDAMISFDFIYEILASHYPTIGRPSVDPVSMFKMLLVGYLYGIKSERRLVEEIQLNVAYCWFCGFELGDTIPDHSTVSKTRVRKWDQSNLFQSVFHEIVRRCVESGLVDGKSMAADGSYLPANVSRNSWVDVELEVEQSMQSYLDRLDEELAAQLGFKRPVVPLFSISEAATSSGVPKRCCMALKSAPDSSDRKLSMLASSCSMMYSFSALPHGSRLRTMRQYFFLPIVLTPFKNTLYALRHCPIFLCQCLQVLFSLGFQMVIDPGHAPTDQNLLVRHITLIKQLVQNWIQRPFFCVQYPAALLRHFLNELIAVHVLLA